VADLKWQGMWTERDGNTPCFVRILTVVGVAAFFGLTALSISKGQQPDFVQWATAFTVITAGGAAAARVKLETEDKPQ
jgi:hypothetical protein